MPFTENVDRNKELVKDRESGMTWMKVAQKYGLSSPSYAQTLYKRHSKKYGTNK